MRRTYIAIATPTATGLVPTQNTARQARCMPTNGTMRVQSTRSRAPSGTATTPAPASNQLTSARHAETVLGATLDSAGPRPSSMMVRPQFAAVASPGPRPPTRRIRRSLTTLRGSSQIERKAGPKAGSSTCPNRPR